MTVGVFNGMGEGPFSQVVRVFSAEEGESVDTVQTMVLIPQNAMLSLLSARSTHGLCYLEPSEAPSRVWARAVSASEIEVSWEPVPSRSSGQKIVAYEVRKRKVVIIAPGGNIQTRKRH